MPFGLKRHVTKNDKRRGSHLWSPRTRQTNRGLIVHTSTHARVAQVTTPTKDHSRMTRKKAEWHAATLKQMSVVHAIRTKTARYKKTTNVGALTCGARELAKTNRGFNPTSPRARVAQVTTPTTAHSGRRARTHQTTAVCLWHRSE
jgi:hypothetical protein